MKIGDEVVCIDPCPDDEFSEGVVCGNRYPVLGIVPCVCGNFGIQVGILTKKPYDKSTVCVCKCGKDKTMPIAGMRSFSAKRFAPIDGLMNAEINEEINELILEPEYV